MRDLKLMRTTPWCLDFQLDPIGVGSNPPASKVVQSWSRIAAARGRLMEDCRPPAFATIPYGDACVYRGSAYAIK
jgi:hypothetical protein